MPTPKLDPKLKKRVVDLKAKGYSHREVSRIAKVSEGTVSNCLREYVPIERSDKKTGELHWREITPWLQRGQQLKRKASWTQDDKLAISLGDGKRPIILATFSDMHLGAWGCDYSAFTELTEELLNTPDLYIALLGDYTEHAIKMRSVLESAGQILPPELQTAFFESWLMEVKHRIAFATWENHSIERAEKQAGESTIKNLLARNVAYFSGIAHVTVKTGQQTYELACSHKFRGRSYMNPVHSQQRYMRFEGNDRELAMAGDSHTPGMLKYTDGTKTRVAINTGSLHINSGFGKRYFSLTTHPVYPCVILHPDRHEMTPFWSVKEALTFLSAQK